MWILALQVLEIFSFCFSQSSPLISVFCPRWHNNDFLQQFIPTTSCCGAGIRTHVRQQSCTRQGPLKDTLPTELQCRGQCQRWLGQTDPPTTEPLQVACFLSSHDIQTQIYSMTISDSIPECQMFLIQVIRAHWDIPGNVEQEGLSLFVKIRLIRSSLMGSIIVVITIC